MGIAGTGAGSFRVHEHDTIATVQALELQVLRELVQHPGHADILREQILASR